MADTSFLSSAAFGGDWMSLFDPSALGAEEGFGLLDDYLEVARHSEPHGFPGDKAKAGSSEWLLVDGLVGAPDVGRGEWGPRAGLAGVGLRRRGALTRRGRPRLVLQRMLSPGPTGWWRRWT